MIRWTDLTMHVDGATQPIDVGVLVAPSDEWAARALGWRALRAILDLPIEDTEHVLEARAATHRALRAYSAPTGIAGAAHPGAKVAATRALAAIGRCYAPFGGPYRRAIYVLQALASGDYDEAAEFGRRVPEWS